MHRCIHASDIFALISTLLIRYYYYFKLVGDKTELWEVWQPYQVRPVSSKPGLECRCVRSQRFCFTHKTASTTPLLYGKFLLLPLSIHLKSPKLYMAKKTSQSLCIPGGSEGQKHTNLVKSLFFFFVLQPFSIWR